jgi:hypothetical protein
MTNSRKPISLCSPAIKRGDRSAVEGRRQCDEKLTQPVAVFPNRVNRRLTSQAGVFTIHGGKHSASDNTFPAPVPLDDPRLLPGSKFLWSFEIEGSKKDDIARQLMALGIHKGTLFPDLDQQASHLKYVWSRSAL